MCLIILIYVPHISCLLFCVWSSSLRRCMWVFAIFLLWTHSMWLIKRLYMFILHRRASLLHHTVTEDWIIKMDEHMTFITLAEASQDPLTYVKAFVPLALTSSLDGEMLLSLFRLGITYHQPMEVPETGNIDWKEAIIRCLESLLSRDRNHAVRRLPQPTARANSRPSAQPTIYPLREVHARAHR